jgi:hypothetical protein
MKRFLITAEVKVIVGLLCLCSLAMPIASAYAESFHFTITSDQRGGADAKPPLFSRTLQAINNMVGGPGAFHVSVGDIDYAATNPSNRALIDANFGSNCVWYGVVGNHDAESAADMTWLREEYNTGHNFVRTPLQNLISRPGPTGSVETTYSWDYGNAHFVVLNCYWDGPNTTDANVNGGKITPALNDWLEDDLTATNKPFIFIFIHEPAFPYNHHYGDSLDQWAANRDAFWSLLESENVSAVFVGHTHYYYKHQGDVNGHTYNYPAINSWRTQDPAVAGLYGQVWQISTGNAGWKPGGGDAAPNQSDWLTEDLWWNGVEFIDVNVTENIATINVYRDTHTESYDNPSDLGTQFALDDTIIPQPATVPVIYGYVLDSNATPLADVNLSAGNGWFDVTDANGYYEIPVHYGWSGTITPGKADYTFEPNGILYSNVTADIADQNYSATYAPDFIPPEPDPMTWASLPTATGPTSITMTATTASDDTPPVMYYFECINDGNANSNWQTNPTYVAGGLSPGTEYTFRVKAGDSAAAQNETAWSTEQSATTQPPPVSILGSWVTGLTHTKESGTNRALVFIAHAERSGSITLNSVTYGGRTMTKVVERIISSGTTRTYVAAFILNEAGISAATTTTFSPSWSSTPTSYVYSSVFLQNVNQSTLTGATASNATSTGATITTSSLANSIGDMVIDAATCSSTGSYTVNNGFTEALELTITNADAVDGYKSATGASETPSVTHSTTTSRQSLIGFVVKVVPLEATNPNPADGATNVGVTTDLSWTAGVGATSHDVYFGTSNPPPFQSTQASTTYDTGTMSTNTTYYWRIDEKNASGTTLGTIWSFTTVPLPPGQASNPNPADGATNVSLTTDLSWTAGAGATSHDVYFGTSNPPPFKVNQTSTTYDTGTMSSNTPYYWRIDEKNAGGITQGTVWSFTTTAQAPPVSILGSWVTGLTHTKESGTNRALVFIAHAERSGSITLNSVTYGGRTMTKVVERIISSGTTRTYVAAFILNDAGITAATTTTFSPSWSTTPTSSAYASVFLQNVNQSTLTGATASNATSTGATITTSSLANSNGDMIIDAATCSNTGTYTTNNGFTKGVDFSVSNFDGVDGHKSATGANETPSVTHSTTTGRQSLVGFVVRCSM